MNLILNTQNHDNIHGYLWYPWCQTCVCTIHQFIYKFQANKHRITHAHVWSTSRIGVIFPTARPRFHDDVRRSGRVTILNWPDNIQLGESCLHDLVEERAFFVVSSSKNSSNPIICLVIFAEMLTNHHFNQRFNPYLWCLHLHEPPKFSLNVLDIISSCLSPL